MPLYAGLGSTAVFVFPQLVRGAGATALSLAVAGGAVYTLGALAYGLKRPDPWPRVFGFHEVFHACTVAAFASSTPRSGSSSAGPSRAAALRRAAG